MCDSYYCEICNEQYDIHSLYACYQGHFFCQSCFRQEYYKGKEQRCPHLTCNAWINSAKPLKPSAIGEPIRITSKMFPQPTIYSETKPSHLNINSYNRSNISLLSLSKKPLQCPYKECNRTIAVDSIRSHFQYEHKHVAFIDTHLEARNGLEFYLDDVKENEKLCIVLIHILDEPEDEVSKFLYAEMAKPVLVVMASRVVTYNHNRHTERGDDEEFCDCYIPSEKVIIWVGSNIATKYSYTLAISTQCNGIREKFFGPLLPINEDFKKLCAEGKGLILTSHHNAVMTENGAKPLILDILIHNTDEVSRCA